MTRKYVVRLNRLGLDVVGGQALASIGLNPSRRSRRSVPAGVGINGGC